MTRYFIRVQLVQEHEAKGEKALRSFDVPIPKGVRGVYTSGGYLEAVTWYENLEQVMTGGSRL